MSTNSIMFEGEIDEESFTELVAKIQAIEGPFEFWLSTPGGRIDYAETILDILHERKCSFVGFGQLSSAGFRMFMDFKGPKRLVKGTIGMTHIGEFSHSLREDLSTALYVKEVKKDSKLRFAKYIKEEVPKWGLTKTQLKHYLKGEDVFISYEQLKQHEQRETNTEGLNKVSNRPNKRAKGRSKSDQSE